LQLAYLQRSADKHLDKVVSRGLRDLFMRSPVTPLLFPIHYLTITVISLEITGGS